MTLEQPGLSSDSLNRSGREKGATRLILGSIFRRLPRVLGPKGDHLKEVSQVLSSSQGDHPK